MQKSTIRPITGTSTMRLLKFILFALILLATRYPLLATPTITQDKTNPRIYTVEFNSPNVPKNPMALTVILPEGLKPFSQKPPPAGTSTRAGSSKSPDANVAQAAKPAPLRPQTPIPPLSPDGTAAPSDSALQPFSPSALSRTPVIYILHGLGRTERTLVENQTTLARLLASPCAIVMPRGRAGWYINSRVAPNERYADYIDEAIALAEKLFPIGNTPATRAITGWSMGGYGAAYTATRRPHDFAALATMIGLLDFPRPEIPNSNKNYTVRPCYGTDPAVWKTLNPLHNISKIRHLPLCITYATRAPESEMNENFIAAAKAQGNPIEVQTLDGGHAFPMVEQSLPTVLTFLESILLKTPKNSTSLGTPKQPGANVTQTSKSAPSTDSSTHSLPTTTHPPPNLLILPSTP